jgi:hypothetical protein
MHPTVTTTTTARRIAATLTTRRIAVVIGLLALAAAAALASDRPSAVPTDLDVGTTRTTDAGLYRVGYESAVEPVPVNLLHTWIITVETPSGEPVTGAEVTFDGDMPQHGHGLPTVPEVTHEISPGRYLVEGVKFQMGGWWVMDVGIVADGRSDGVSFNLILSR